ncbi:MAG: DNA polymerase III subunit gamma/tau [Methylococcales bacterium]|nr:DNA polymerase III subunit gamma/tau [Methylococcales bacterium]MDD5753584.1 DNA polymerase III subunit gamma/tau [Methylococcales bacterium]
MNYQVLARKWRPHNFTEVVGQTHVITSLTNALKHNRLHQAYLFTGTRGVGKTTLARILAKAMNCENLQDFNPCGQCDICRAVDEGRFLDLIEVDAASRTKVEDTRDLLDNAQYAPNQGRYKVYLIDEVHMLSGHSFNALLKTLEEPPPHVKFLLATTDPHKIPVTVLSRCLQLNLKRLLPSEIFTQMGFILGQEHIAFEPEALKLISRAADGSMRDGLSLLDQAIVYGNGQVNNDDVHAMLGSIAQQPVESILHALAQADAPAILNQIDDLSQLSPDFGDLLQQLLQFLHRIALVQHVPTTLTHDLDAEVVAHLAKTISPEDVQLYYQIGLLGQKDLELAPDPRSGFEMVMLRMFTFRPVKSENVAPQLPNQNVTPMSQARPQVQIQPPQTAPVSETPRITDNWNSIVSGLKGMTKQFASRCVLEQLDESQCRLSLDPEFQSLLDQDSAAKLENALRDLLAKPLKLYIEVKALATHTPAQQVVQAQENRQQLAVEAIHQDPNVIYAKTHFDAQVLPETIQPY